MKLSAPKAQISFILSVLNFCAVHDENSQQKDKLKRSSHRTFHLFVFLHIIIIIIIFTSFLLRYFDITVEFVTFQYDDVINGSATNTTIVVVEHSSCDICAINVLYV